MKAITVTAARRRFGALLDAVQDEPVLISRKNRDACIVIRGGIRADPQLEKACRTSFPKNEALPQLMLGSDLLCGLLPSQPWSGDFEACLTRTRTPSSLTP
jgi:malonyl CoA-acyl carrier protein transacylase